MNSNEKNIETAMRGAAAYIFDLDGTLVDTEFLWVDALIEYLHTLGIEISRDRAGSIILGHAWSGIYRDIIAQWPQMDRGEKIVADELHPFFLRLSESTDVMIHSSVEKLRELSASTPTVIVSGSPREDVERAIERMGIGGCLKFFLGYEDYERGKPSPDGFLTAARRLGAAPASCVVFEDSSAGIKAAKSAGMFCVALARPIAPKQDTSPADLVLPDLVEFSPSLLDFQHT